MKLGIFQSNRFKSFHGEHLVNAISSQSNVTTEMLTADISYRPRLLKRLSVRIKRQFGAKTYLWEKEVRRCRAISAQLDTVAQESKVDAVLIFGSEFCAYSRCTVPMFAYGDSIFGSRFETYPDQQNVCDASIAEGVEIQQRSLNLLRKMFISSDFAWNQALKVFRYTAEREKCEVVGIGANYVFSEKPTSTSHSDAQIRFCWIGTSWLRKGGEFAVSVVRELRRLGVNAFLDAVGDTQLSERIDYVSDHGWVNPRTDEGHRRLQSILHRSSALLLPSQADLTPIVIAEAQSAGCPTVAPTVGGIPQMIDNRRTGLLLSDMSPSLWAESLVQMLQSGQMQAMPHECRLAFENRHNWSTIAARIVTTIRSSL